MSDTDQRRTRKDLGQGLLREAREALADAGAMLQEDRQTAAALLACQATVRVGRSFLALRGLDAGPDLAATAVLFDRQVVAPGHLSAECSVQVHRATRTLRELAEGTDAVVYPARVRRLLEGTRRLLTEAEIVLEPLLV
ncbi:MAG: hypothetical protein ACYS22_04820 [Planctomycetota bacterium]|jgi:hypothetical protein